MPKYTVHLIQTVSTAVIIDAANPEVAIEAAYGSPDMPSGMAHGAFGRASVDEAGEWEAISVSDADGNEVWDCTKQYNSVCTRESVTPTLDGGLIVDCSVHGEIGEVRAPHGYDMDSIPPDQGETLAKLWDEHLNEVNNDLSSR